MANTEPEWHSQRGQCPQWGRVDVIVVKPSVVAVSVAPFIP